MALKNGTRYQWSDESTFSLDSKEFSTLLNSLNQVVGNPLWGKVLEDAHQKVFEGSQVIAIGRLQELMNGVLQKSLDAGIVSEVPEEPSNNIPFTPTT